MKILKRAILVAVLLLVACTSRVNYVHRVEGTVVNKSDLFQDPRIGIVILGSSIQDIEKLVKSGIEKYTGWTIECNISKESIDPDQFEPTPAYIESLKAKHPEVRYVIIVLQNNCQIKKYPYTEWETCSDKSRETRTEYITKTSLDIEVSLVDLQRGVLIATSRDTLIDAPSNKGPGGCKPDGEGVVGFLGVLFSTLVNIDWAMTPEEERYPEPRFNDSIVENYIHRFFEGLK